MRRITLMISPACWIGWAPEAQAVMTAGGSVHGEVEIGLRRRLKMMGFARIGSDGRHTVSALAEYGQAPLCGACLACVTATGAGSAAVAREVR